MDFNSPQDTLWLKILLGFALAALLPNLYKNLLAWLTRKEAIVIAFFSGQYLKRRYKLHVVDKEAFIRSKTRVTDDWDSPTSPKEFYVLLLKFIAVNIAAGLFGFVLWTIYTHFYY